MLLLCILHPNSSLGSPYRPMSLFVIVSKSVIVCGAVLCNQLHSETEKKSVFGCSQHVQKDSLTNSVVTYLDMSTRSYEGRK